MYIYLCVLMSFCLCVCVHGSVLDVNDETPTFNPRVYNVSLKESVPRDHIVARLSCTDNDAGLNAELSYFITGQSSQWELFLCVCELQCCTVSYVHIWYLCPSICLCVCTRWACLFKHYSCTVCVSLGIFITKMLWMNLEICLCFVFLGGNQDGKFSVGFRDGVVRTVVGLDREIQAAYTLVVEAIGVPFL